MNDVAHDGSYKSRLRRFFPAILDRLDIDRALRASRAAIDNALSGLAKSGGELRVIAMGKAAVPMTRWLLDTYPSTACRGVLSAPAVGAADLEGIERFAGGHPIPNEQSLLAGSAALRIAREADDSGLVLFLISGGGSALMERPVHRSIRLEDIQEINRVLVGCGADIVEINAVRKRLSGIKGGRLAAAAAPASQLTLYVSDVPAGKESSVASGPTMPDATTSADARRILAKYGLDEKFPRHVVDVLTSAGLPETPKPGERCFDRAQWTCVLENRHATDAALRLAKGEGWDCVLDTSTDDTEVARAADMLLERLRALRASSTSEAVCVIAGGELSSPVRGDGIGGRNQAFVLECVGRIAGERIAVMSVGTDGIDGNSPAAGAVADGGSLDRASAAGLRPDACRRRSDSHTFFKAIGDDITCGATQNNVRDVRMLVSWRD